MTDECCDFLDFANAWDLSNVNADEVATWPDDQLEELGSAAQSMIERQTESSLRTLNQARRPLVLCPELQARHSASILSRCMLYADWVVLPIAFPVRDGSLTDAGHRMLAVQAVKDFQERLPYFRDGLCLPVQSRPLRARFDGECTDECARLLEDQRLLDVISTDVKLGRRTLPARAERADGERVDATAEQTYAAFDDAFHLRVQGSGPPHTKLLVPLSPHGEFQLVPQSEYEASPELQQLVKNLVVTRLEGIIDDYNVAVGTYNGGIVTRSPIAWEVVSRIDSTRGRSTARTLFDLDLPFIETAKPNVIAELRSKYASSFDQFRVALDEMSVELGKIDATDDRAVRLLQSELMDAPLREIGARLDEVGRQRLAEIVGGLIVMSSAVVVAAFAGAPLLATAATGLSGAAALKTTDAVANLLRERASLARSPMHFLWNVKKRLEI